MSGEIVPSIVIPDEMRHLHWVVSSWVQEHKTDQAERARAIKNANPDDMWIGDPIANLTDRDQYRFRVTSALLQSLEQRGAQALSGNVCGKLKATIGGFEIEFTVAEKMEQHRRPSIQNAVWTAFPRHQYSNRSPTGFLRFTIDTYIGKHKKPQWVETNKKKAPEILPDFITSLNAAPDILRQREKELEEFRRELEHKRQREEEVRRLAQIETERWQQFQELSNNWAEAQRLRRFLIELQVRPHDFAYEIEGMTVDEYTAWARKKTDELDPFVRLASSDKG